MLSNKKIKRELMDQGHDRAIDGILRSKNTENELDAVEKALKILKDPDEIKKIAKRIRRESQRIKPESSVIQASFEVIQNSPITKIASAFLPLAAALVFFLLYQIYTKPDQLSGLPKITYAGKSTSLIRNNKIIHTKLNMEILNQDSITIPYGKKITITYDDGSTIDLLSSSTTSFGQKKNVKNKNHQVQKLIQLKYGDIKVSAAPQSKGRPMILKTDNASIQVIGTKFNLSSDKEKTSIQMEKGVVILTNLTTKKSINVKNNQSAYVLKETISLNIPKVKTIKKKIHRINVGCLVSYQFSENYLVNTNHIKNIFPKDKEFSLISTSKTNPIMLKSGGMSIDTPTTLTNKINATELLKKIQSSNQFSLEIWIKPSNIKNENDHSTLIAASKDKALFGQPLWLFFLGQKEKDLVLLINTDLPDDIDKQLEFKDVFQDTSTVHLVITKDLNGIVSLYKNGQFQESQKTEGNLNNWFSKEDLLRLDLAGNNTRSHFWNGIFYLAAIYNRTLTKKEIQNNFKAKY